MYSTGIPRYWKKNNINQQLRYLKKFKQLQEAKYRCYTYYLFRRGRGQSKGSNEFVVSDANFCINYSNYRHTHGGVTNLLVCPYTIKKFTNDCFLSTQKLYQHREFQKNINLISVNK